MPLKWIAFTLIAVQSVHPGGLSPFPLPGTEWAMGKTVAELRRTIGGGGKFKPVIAPTRGRTGYADYVVDRCLVSFGLSPGLDGEEPIVDSILAQHHDGKLMVFPEAADCFAAVHPERRSK